MPRKVPCPHCGRIHTHNCKTRRAGPIETGPAVPGWAHDELKGDAVELEKLVAGAASLDLATLEARAVGLRAVLAAYDARIAVLRTQTPGKLPEDWELVPPPTRRG